MSIREQLRGVIRKTRDMGDVEDDNHYAVLDAERERRASTSKTVNIPVSPTRSLASLSPTGKSLAEMMKEQQNQLKEADDVHKKEYLPMLNEAVLAVGGDPNAPLKSGGSGALSYSSTPAKPQMLRERSPSLRDVLSGIAQPPMTNNSNISPRVHPMLNRSPSRGRSSTDGSNPTSPPAMAKPPVQQRSASPNVLQSALSTNSLKSVYRCTPTHSPVLAPSTPPPLARGAGGGSEMAPCSLENTANDAPDVLDATQTPSQLQKVNSMMGRRTRTPSRADSFRSREGSYAASPPATGSPSGAPGRGPRSFGGGVIRPSPASGGAPISLKDMMNDQSSALKEAEKRYEQQHVPLRDAAFKEIERLEAEGKWRKA